MSATLDKLQVIAATLRGWIAEPDPNGKVTLTLETLQMMAGVLEQAVAQQAATPLTDDVIDSAIVACPLQGYSLLSVLRDDLTCGQFKDTARRWVRAVVAALGQPHAPAPAEPVRVYLVATGLTHEGRELYERYDVRPPLCDAETLYAAPPAAPAAPQEEA